jgi:hypothetical protein
MMIVVLRVDIPTRCAYTGGAGRPTRTDFSSGGFADEGRGVTAFLRQASERSVKGGRKKCIV